MQSAFGSSFLSQALQKLTAGTAESICVTLTRDCATAAAIELPGSGAINFWITLFGKGWIVGPSLA
jgi:hypothetical protein